MVESDHLEGELTCSINSRQVCCNSSTLVAEDSSVVCNELNRPNKALVAVLLKARASSNSSSVKDGSDTEGDKAII